MTVQKLLNTFAPVRAQRFRQRPAPSATKTLDKLRADPRVRWVDDERAIGNNILVTLQQGWTFTAGEDNRVDGADNAAEAARLVKGAVPFEGPYYE